MQTPSHFLITAVIKYTNKRPFTIPLSTAALLVGSVLPDIPLILLTVFYGAYYRWVAPLPDAAVLAGDSVMEYLHMTLFFTDPVWIIGHNFFHSLVINMLLIVLGYLAFRHGRSWGIVLFSLGISAQFHTILDIFTHNSDGPLLFFPLNWTYRFPSPISYWEADYHGRAFMIFEYTLNALIIGFFVWTWFKKRNRSSQT